MKDSRTRGGRNKNMDNRNWDSGEHAHHCSWCESCMGISISQNLHPLSNNCPVGVNDVLERLLWKTTFGSSCAVTAASSSFHNCRMPHVCVSYKTHKQNWGCASQRSLGTQRAWWLRTYLQAPHLRSWGWRIVGHLKPDWAAWVSPKAAKAI